MKIFDVHTHIFPEKIAARTLAHLRELSSNIPTYTEGTAASLAGHAAEAGYTGWLNCPVVTRPDQLPGLNDHVAAYNRWPHLSLGGIHPDCPDIPAELRRVKRLGLLGIKLHPEYQEFFPLERKMAIFWETCQDLELPVLVHAGKDIGFPGWHHSLPEDFAGLINRYPKLTLICAHMGGWDCWQEVLDQLAGLPVYLDTSFSKPWMKDQTLFRKIIQRHGTGRILFGSDSPWSSLTDSIRQILDLKLPRKDQEDIFWNNADRIFHLEQRMRQAGQEPQP